MIVLGEHVCEWVSQRTGAKYFPKSGQGIGLERHGVMVAGVLYDTFNGNSIQTHIAGDGTRAWMTREYLRVIFDYPFRQLQVKKIISLVDSANADSRRFVEHIGFVLEAVITDAARQGDQLIYTMTRQQCRWIKD